MRATPPRDVQHLEQSHNLFEDLKVGCTQPSDWIPTLGRIPARVWDKRCGQATVNILASAPRGPSMHNVRESRTSNGVEERIEETQVTFATGQAN